MQNILCADIGTTSLKMGIISESGEVVSFTAKTFNTENTSFIANQWFNAFLTACKELTKNIEISAISISGNGPSLVSQNGRSLLWNNELVNQIKTEISQTKSLYIPQFLAFKKFFPDEWQSSDFIFSGPEFLIYKLSGKAFSLLPAENFLPAYWTDQELEKFNLEKEKIPPFIKPGKEFGRLNKKLAEELNLPQISVFCGGPDFITALLGTGTVEAGKLCDRSGSSEGINFCSDKAVFEEGIRTLPSVIPGLWNISILIPQAGSLLNQYKNEITALEGKELSWDEIIDYSFDDKNSEGWGILNNLSASVRTALLKLKALAEKYNLKIENKMAVTGGQSKNSKWMQKKADDLKFDLKICNTKDAELTGNAIIAFYGLGKFSSLEEGAKKLVRSTKTYRPQTDSKQKMQIYKIPDKLTTIIFDIDSTLYTNPSYAYEQVDIQIRYWAKKAGITDSQARNKISEYRKNWSKEHDGKKISLGNTFINFGVSIQDSVEMRKNLLEPKKFLSKDEQLISTIKCLKEKFKLICVTNNPVLPARKTLEAIGISELIPDIIGLDTCGKSKPALEPFELALKITDSKAEECLSIGDRYDMDLALPLKMGMGAILVSGVSDIYKLTQVLIK